jgi:hypothetical protein
LGKQGIESLSNIGSIKSIEKGLKKESYLEFKSITSSKSM